jgi:hypothetical protein
LLLLMVAVGPQNQQWPAELPLALELYPSPELLLNPTCLQESHRNCHKQQKQQQQSQPEQYKDHYQVL